MQNLQRDLDKLIQDDQKHDQNLDPAKNAKRANKRKKLLQTIKKLSKLTNITHQKSQMGTEYKRTTTEDGIQIEKNQL